MPLNAGLTVRIPAIKNAPPLEKPEMTNTNFTIESPPELPATVVDLLAQRKTLRTRSLNDDVDECHLKLWEDPEYRKWFAAIHPSQAVEGSFVVDDVKAADMIRDFAIANRIPIAANAKLAAIIYSLHVVCRRYRMSRNDRRNVVNGEHVDMNEAAE